VSGAPQHVALNAVFLQPQMGGIEVMVNRVVPEMVRLWPRTRFSVFVGPRGLDLLRTEVWTADVALETHPLLGLPGGRAISELTLLGWLAPRRGAEVLYSVALTGPLRTRCAHVVNVADTTWLTHPDPGEIATVRLWRAIVPPVVRRADRVVAISEAGRRDIVERLRVPRERVDLALTGPGRPPASTVTPEAEVRSRLALGDGPVVLSVQAQKAHKNLERLVRAFVAVAAEHPDARLVIPGNLTDHGRELQALAGSLGLGDVVVFPGWVSDEDLEGLYDAAALSVVASLNEGFGLPVLESMQRGVPVASSNAGALPEAGGDAAVYFDPSDTDAIAAAIKRLLGDPVLRSALAERGREWAATFTWERCAEDTLASLERAWRERHL
jgi:glycosyltransferase involved in cell wall biosynthesis